MVLVLLPSSRIFNGSPKTAWKCSAISGERRGWNLQETLYITTQKTGLGAKIALYPSLRFTGTRYYKSVIINIYSQ
jgi:hypothetical protein